jgi:glycosyltransferase involved in cell wall biosynthesis
MKLLLLAHAFPPHNASGSVRAGKLAEYFHECGYDVRVLTAAPLAYPPTLTTRFPVAQVITTPWLDLYAPLDWLRQRVGGGAGGAAAPGTKPGLAARLVRLYRALLGVPDGQAGWIPYALLAGRVLGRTWRPDLIYSTALPLSSHVVAARLARRFACPWVAEYRDLFADNPYQDVPAWRRGIDRWLERRVMRSAAGAVTISPPMADTLARTHGKPVACIPNGFDPEDFAGATEGAPFDPTKLTILYAGIIYPGRRDPTPLFAALQALGPLRERVEVRFHGQDLRGVADLAARHGVTACVRIGAPVPYRTSLAWQKQADILLLLLWDDPREKAVCPGKLFEYAGAGRPILSLGCADGVAADLIRTRRLGTVAADAGDVETALRRWLGEKQTGAVLPPPEEGRAGLSRQSQFAALTSFLRRNGWAP